MDYNLLQKHTVEIYQLKDRECSIHSVPARSLLKPQRFDLFAKLYYIGNVSTNRDTALMVYAEHIKAFNPDGREPGRDDKDGVRDFVSVFDGLIEHFKNNDFDDSKSVVPVDKNGVILDGAHRVAALAYYGKNVTIAQFDEVESKCDFDYIYFKNRGLSWDVADMIALEMVKWAEQLLVACIWPSTNAKQKAQVMDYLAAGHVIAYRKDVRCDLRSMSNFVGYIYREQDWTLNPDSVFDKASRVYGKSPMSIVLFMAKTGLDSILEEKERIRKQLGHGKDSLHITDNHHETLDIAKITLDSDCMKQWMTSQTIGMLNKLCSSIQEQWTIFKKIHWISFKVFVSKLLQSIKS